MSSIDDRIIQLKFDNKGFGAAVLQTIQQLAKLKESLNLQAASKGLDTLGASAKRLDLSGIGSAVEGISGRFLAMSTIAVTALSRITNEAITAGDKLVKSLTVQPITDGLHEYETNLNAIQTILANTQVSGATLDDVNDALNQLNHYSDLTIYNFAQMAKNIGTFTAAGVDLKTSVEAIKGIANLAALSGSNADQAATAMYQLSQAIASGKVNLQDWNSVVNAGMGGTVFQRALAETAVAMGKIKQGSLTLQGTMKNVVIDGKSFRDSISGGDSWLTSDVLTTTLKEFTGDLTDAQLAAIGFKQDQIAAIQQTAKTAFHAATEVKTLGQVIDVARESAGSGWAQTWQTIFGDFGESKATFTDLSNDINGFINNLSNARNKVLDEWKKLGGRNVAIEGIKAAFDSLVSFVKPIHDAFRDIFPTKTGQDLFDLTTKFRDFFKNLKLGKDTSDDLRSTFRGVFAAFDIGKQILVAVGKLFTNLFASLTGGDGGLLHFTGHIGDLIVAIDKSLKSGNGLNKFFGGIGKLLAIPIKLFGQLLGFISKLFGLDTKHGIDGLNSSLGTLGDKIGNFADKAQTALTNVVDKIKDAFSSDNFQHILDTLGVVFLGGLVLLLRKFAKTSLKIDLPGLGLFKSAKETLDTLRESLETMQKQLKVNSIKKIAEAVALLAAAVVALSLVDPKKLGDSLLAMSVGFAELLVAMAILVKIADSEGFLKIPAIALGMNLLATAIDILSAAVVILSKLKWEDLTKGLLGVAGLLLILSKAVAPLSANSKGLIAAGTGILILAIGMKQLADAITMFSKLDFGNIGKGLITIAGALIIISGAMSTMPPNLPVTAAGLLLVGLALNSIAKAFKTIGTENFGQIATGMVAFAGALIIISGAMSTMPPNMIVQAAGLVLVGIALGNIAKAVKSLGEMSVEQIAKGLITLAGAFVILVPALTAMTGTLAGAAALIVVAAGIALLAPALALLGSLSWKSIATGLIALAGAFAVIGVAGLVLAPITPAIALLGAAILILGAGLALAGAGVLLFASAFAIFVGAFAAGAGIAIKSVRALIQLIPEAAVGLANGVIQFIITLGKGAAQIIGVISGFIIATLNAIIQLAPAFANTALVLLKSMLDVFLGSIGLFVNAGLTIIFAFLAGVASNITRFANVATDIVVGFIDAMAKNSQRLVNAGFNFIVTFLNGVSKAIRDNSGRLGDEGRNIGISIVYGMINGLYHLSGLNLLVNAIKYIAGLIPTWIKKLLGISSPSKAMMKLGKFVVQGLANGMRDNGDIARLAAQNVAIDALNTVRATLNNISDLSISGVEFNPVITPVLDLSTVKKQAGTLDQMFNQPILAPILNAAQPPYIIDKRPIYIGTPITPVATSAAKTVATVNNSYEYVQNISSPQALSTAEVYRQTRNLLSITKEAVMSNAQ